MRCSCMSVAAWLEMVEIIIVASGWADLCSWHHGKWDKLLLSNSQKAELSYRVSPTSATILNLALFFDTVSP